APGPDGAAPRGYPGQHGGAGRGGDGLHEYHAEGDGRDARPWRFRPRHAR
ncbi:hypothetical protein THAOC_16977, partial [Thalassiosira oceanica]